ncbi:MAG: hypothetical protein JWN94_677 [Betaproteobacteria bacterium]|nr:hypothetical protein [Betaproteobacteria bacterium]
MSGLRQDETSLALIAWCGMVALAVAMGVGRFAFTPLLPMMQDDHALTVAAGTWLATANYAGYLAGALIALARPVRPAAAIGGGLLAIALATFGMGLTEDFAAWLALRAAAGVASAWVMIYVSSAFVGQLAQRGAEDLNGRIFAGVGLGIAAAGVVSLVLMTMHSTAAVAWMLFGGASLIAALAIAPVLRARHDDTARAAPAADREAMRWDGAAWRMIVCFASSGFGYIVPATFLPAMAKALIQEPAIFGWSWPVFGAAALVSTLTASALRRRMGNRRSWIASQTVMAIGVALPAFAGGIAAIILSGLMVGGTFMIITMSAMQEAKAIAGSQAVRLVSALTAAFAIGQLIGPLSVRAVLALGGGFSAALVLAAAVLIAGAALLRGGAPAARTADCSA